MEDGSGWYYTPESSNSSQTSFHSGGVVPDLTNVVQRSGQSSALSGKSRHTKIKNFVPVDTSSPKKSLSSLLPRRMKSSQSEQNFILSPPLSPLKSTDSARDHELLKQTESLRKEVEATRDWYIRNKATNRDNMRCNVDFYGRELKEWKEFVENRREREKGDRVLREERERRRRQQLDDILVQESGFVLSSDSSKSSPELLWRHAGDRKSPLWDTVVEEARTNTAAGVALRQSHSNEGREWNGRSKEVLWSSRENAEEERIRENKMEEKRRREKVKTEKLKREQEVQRDKEKREREEVRREKDMRRREEEKDRERGGEERLGWTTQQSRKDRQGFIQRKEVFTSSTSSFSRENSEELVRPERRPRFHQRKSRVLTAPTVPSRSCATVIRPRTAVNWPRAASSFELNISPVRIPPSSLRSSISSEPVEEERRPPAKLKGSLRHSSASRPVRVVRVIEPPRFLLPRPKTSVVSSKRMSSPACDVNAIEHLRKLPEANRKMFGGEQVRENLQEPTASRGRPRFRSASVNRIETARGHSSGGKANAFVATANGMSHSLGANRQQLLSLLKCTLPSCQQTVNDFMERDNHQDKRAFLVKMRDHIQKRTDYLVEKEAEKREPKDEDKRRFEHQSKDLLGKLTELCDTDVIRSSTVNQLRALHSLLQKTT